MLQQPLREALNLKLEANTSKGNAMNQAFTPTKSRVFISDADYSDGLKPLVQEILRLFPLDWKGKTVLLKPNILAPHPPERGVTTHPLLVRFVAEALLEKGARVLAGDNPGVGGYGRAEASARACGLLEAVPQGYINLGRSPVQTPVDSRYLSSVAISREVLESDAVINLPKLKTHSLTFLTASIKNTFGHVVGGDKMRLHSLCPTPQQFAEALVDIFALRPPTLTIMDAVLCMEGNGPANGRPRQVNKILASDNAVSLDAAAIRLLGKKPAQVPHLDIAGKRGLGETNLERIDLLGNLEPVEGFRFPKTFIPGLTGILLNRYLSRWINCIPEIMPERCRSCGLCAEHCPAGAMQMTDNGPRLDRDACIHCYCCQELCPENAIRFSGRLMSWISRE